MHNKYTLIQNIQYFFVCLFFASLNFEMFSPIIPNFSVAKMAALMYIGVSLFTPRSLFTTSNIRKPLVSIFIMYFLMVFSSIIHMEDYNSTIVSVTILLNILMFWILINHQRRDERVFSEGLLWFSVSAFIVGIFYYLGIGVTIDDDMRVVLFGENANALGLKMGVGILLILNYCLSHSNQKPIYRPWLLVMVVPMLLLLFATASRIALLVLSSGFVLFVLFRQSKRGSAKILWLVIGVTSIYYGYQIILQQEVLMARMETTIDEGNISGRDYIWTKYMELIPKHPILGVGFSGAHKFAIDVFGGSRSPHNVLIEVTVYSGILGLACFVRFLLCVFYDVFRYYKKEHYLGPMITSMTVIGMVFSGQAFGVKMFWVLAAYSISYRVLDKKSIEQSYY